MEKLSVREVLKATKGVLLDGSAEFLVDSVSINSKKIKKGAVFVPIMGENVDGHGFIEEAFEAGAVATLISKNDVVAKKKDKAYIKVKDTKLALQQLAEYYRKKFDIPIIGVTGSVGKTSTKEMIASALSARFNVYKTYGNLNGQLGLPLSILELEHKHDVAVIEMGISEPEEMDKLVKIAMPNCAVITNIGVTHIENLHTRENIFKEKFKITNYFKNSNCLFINGDDPLLCNVQKNNQFEVDFFGIKNDCKFRAKNIFCQNGKTKFELICNNVWREFIIPIIGEHNVYNALAAIAVGSFLGMSLNEIQNGLLQFKNLAMRQNVYHLNGIILVDDTYNANPDSMKSALNVLKQISKDNGKKIAVLADMLELGDLTQELHFEVGENVAHAGVDILITVGNLAKFIAKGAMQHKKYMKIYSVCSNKEAIDCLKKVVSKNDSILVKGSRGMHAEEISKKIISLYKK